MIYGLAMSLFKWNGISAPTWYGFENFIYMFTKDTVFPIALKNSLFFVVFSLITQQLLGLLIAIILTNNIKFKNLFKNIYYLPVVLSSAAVGLLWMFIFNPVSYTHLDVYKRQVRRFKKDGKAVAGFHKAESS